MATPEQVSAAAGGSYSLLSNEELGDLFADTCRAQAQRRTGSSRDHWRKLLDEPDMVAVLDEFRRRSLQRSLEYCDYLDTVGAQSL